MRFAVLYTFTDFTFTVHCFPSLCLASLVHLILVSSKDAFVWFDQLTWQDFSQPNATHGLKPKHSYTTTSAYNLHRQLPCREYTVSAGYQTSHRRSSTTHVILLITPIRAVLMLVSSVVCATWIAKPVITTAHVATTTLSSWHTAAAAASVVWQSTGRLDTLVHRRWFAGCARRWRRLADKWSWNHIALITAGTARSLQWHV